jgi:hypothetical protein
MAYAFVTESGSVYEVRDGRMTRFGHGDITDAQTGANVATCIKDELVSIRIEPIVGERCVFFIKSEDHPLCGTPITTSPIQIKAPLVDVSFITDEDVESYLAGPC